MKHYYYILFLLSFSLSIFGDTILIEGTWSEKGLHSFSPIPFTIEKEGNSLYIYSNRVISDLQKQIVSIEGTVYHEDLCTFSAFETTTLPLNDLPTGNYFVNIFHRNGYLSGEFVNP
jgi:Protein of unknown function (DUF3244).